VGNSGADELLGGAGRDILIGGNGLDTLDGEDDDDILIAGRTSHDAAVANLNDLRTAWIAGSTYAARITSLRAGVGGTASSLKKKVNVVNDAGENDSLNGGFGDNWYFKAVDDAIIGLFDEETIDLL
jgi:Ca2+-binding RTX toxin-like protein